MLPRPLGSRRTPRRQTGIFSAEGGAPMLSHTNPGCWGGIGEAAGLRRDAGKLHSQQGCSDEKRNQTSYGVD